MSEPIFIYVNIIWVRSSLTHLHQKKKERFFIILLQHYLHILNTVIKIIDNLMMTIYLEDNPYYLPRLLGDVPNTTIVTSNK